MKSCVELLRSCGINYPCCVFRHPCVLFRHKQPPLKTFQPVTLGALVRESGIQGTVCLFTVNQESITTRKEVLRATCCKDHLYLCKIEKSDFLKICQEEGFY